MIELVDRMRKSEAEVGPLSWRPAAGGGGLRGVGGAVGGYIAHRRERPRVPSDARAAPAAPAPAAGVARCYQPSPRPAPHAAHRRGSPAAPCPKARQPGAPSGHTRPHPEPDANGLLLLFLVCGAAD